jgi:glucose 1-dehydrogenase
LSADHLYHAFHHDVTTNNHHENAKTSTEATFSAPQFFPHKNSNFTPKNPRKILSNKHEADSKCIYLEISPRITPRNKMSERLAGKVAIVTGSGSGIGQSIAIRFASEGATVVVDYRDHPAQADDTKAKAEAAGGKAITIQADVAKIADTQSLVDQTWQQLGRCDILVNNAGIEKEAAFLAVTEADYDAVLDVNLKGAFFLTQAFVRRLRDAKQPGRVINISSVHEDMVFPNFSTYCASKGGMRMLMRDLSVELGPLGITVNNIAPGAIATPINTGLMANKAQLDALLANIPLGRMGTPEEVAGVALFLASDDGAYITGSTYVIDGGLMRNYHEQ